jgi:acetyl-CoA C-acetyltransferase
MTAVAITGIAAVDGEPHDSLETLIFRGARAALEDAGLDRAELDGVVIAASDQTDGRAITSMLTSGPAGAYLNDEINVASSPGHALALAYMQILSGTHARLLVSSWGKGSESANGPQAAERLSADPFLERDGGISALAAAALQAQRHRAPDPARITMAAVRVAARNHGDVDAEAVGASALVATPLRALEIPPEADASFSVVLQRGERAVDGVVLAGVGWCADAGRIAERDLAGLPHLDRAARDAYRRAGIEDPAAQIGSWHLHDVTPDAEILAYVPLGLCEAGGALELALSDATGADGVSPVNPGGGSVRGEAPFGGPLAKLVEAVRQARGTATAQVPGVQRALAHLTTGFAGQFQTVAVVERTG